jgi:hypothetical protein
MKTRSYNQYCGLAYALDKVGERWTLLIIRELIAGPRRYTDLLEGLGASAPIYFLNDSRSWSCKEYCVVADCHRQRPRTCTS